MRRKVVVDLCSASVAGGVGSAECIAVYCKGAIYLLPTQSGALELFSFLVFEDGNSFWNIVCTLVCFCIIRTLHDILSPGTK